MMNATHTLRTLLAGTSVALSLLAVSPAFAQVDTGSASASGAYAQLPLGLSLGPVPGSSVSGNGTDNDQVLNVSVFPLLNIDALTTSATSNVDGSAGAKEASSYAAITNLDLNVPLAFGLSFDVLESNSSVTGDAGSFSAIGSSNIVNLQGSGLLSGVNLTAIDGSANQVLLDLAGISIIANRQTSSCDTFSCMITTDALYVNVANITSLTLASTTAMLTGSTAPVPEPSTYAMMVVGLFGIGAMRKWKNRSAA
ncbi:MAG TPA: choice-of-anchor P family protein [Methylophilaceae bacterium]|nr:choice-of-anchor P family protein [Methylophilaceae bacterium]